MLGELNDEHGADGHRHGRARVTNRCGDQKAIHHEGAQRNPAKRITQQELLHHLVPAIDNSGGITDRAEVEMDPGQRHGEQQGGGGEDHHVKQPDDRLGQIQLPTMHRSGQRGADRAGAHFVRHQLGRERDDKNRANVREHDLHRKADIAPGVCRGRVADLPGEKISNHTPQSHHENAEPGQLAARGLRRLVSQ